MTAASASTEGQTSTAGLRLAVTLVALAAGETILWRAGTALPSLRLDGAGILRDLEGVEPLAVAVTLLRLVALTVGAGLLLTSTLGILARTCGAARLVVHLDRWTPAGVRRLLDRALGVGLAASIGLSAVPAAADPGDGGSPAAATLRRLPDAPSTSLRRLPDEPAPTTGPAPPLPQPGGPATTEHGLPDAVARPTVPAPTPAAAPPAPVPVSGPGEVVVQPGDSFWLLAERQEARRLGRQPTEAEVGACWQELVAVNRHRLAVPDDPDLLFPGQTLIVPCR